jgi:hypothetical protein
VTCECWLHNQPHHSVPSCGVCVGVGVGATMWQCVCVRGCVHMCACVWVRVVGVSQASLIEGSKGNAAACDTTTRRGAVTVVR